ncbi:MAG: hypothetical protein U1F81_10545 [Verrucomicrobiaceae bacterium]
MSRRLAANKVLNSDLKRLESRAYGMAEWAGDVLRRYHELRPHFTKQDCAVLTPLYAWVFVPLTLWPFSMTDLLTACLSVLEGGGQLTPELHLIIDLLPPVPNEEICEAVAAHELKVQRGNYEDVVNTQAKFAQVELALKADPSFQKDWLRLKDAFEVERYKDYKGVIRRTLGAERNMRPEFSVNLNKPHETFRLAFDAFCLRWNLYGMQHDEPLLLKLAVNATPHGTMILIPAFWSFDPSRDLRWDAINKLHRLRVRSRQGTALAEGLAERMAQAKRLHVLDAEAKERKLKGEAKHRFLCQGLGLVEDTSAKRLQRLRKEFAKE